MSPASTALDGLGWLLGFFFPLGEREHVVVMFCCHYWAEKRLWNISGKKKSKTTKQRQTNYKTASSNVKSDSLPDLTAKVTSVPVLWGQM